MKKRLLIPGPTEVDPSVAEAGTRPMIGHRGPEIVELLQNILPRVQKLLATESSVYPMGCSATGAMEASIRNAAPGPFLHLVCGAFSKRWSDIRAACGLEGDELVVEWGDAILPEQLAEALDGRSYGAVTLVHNETSTGVMNPLEELGQVVRERSQALLCVDTVSSMAAVELRLDEWGVDVCLAGTQKAWALPPGLTLCAVGPRALERSASATAKGFYFDFLEHEKSLAKWQTPSTPPISLLHQLELQLDRIEAEGPEARYQRHRRMQELTMEWAGRHGLEPFAREGYRSLTLSALRGGSLNLTALLSRAREHGIIIGSGYGKTKGQVFRVGHMGEWNPTELMQVFEILDREIGSMALG